MAEISEDTFKKIEEENIAPKPKWHFLLKNILFWIFFIISLILSSVAASLILFILATSDWDVYDYLGRSFLGHIFYCLPYIWIIAFGALILLALIGFRQTKHGYKREVISVLLVSIIAGIILGLCLLFCGTDSKIHKGLSKEMPFYNNLIYYKEDIWENPDMGLLGGEVISFENKNKFAIKDLNGDIWNIIGGNVLWHCKDRIGRGVEIKIIGHQEPNKVFYANIIHCWQESN